MFAIHVGDDVYRLSESSADELVRRIPRPALEDGQPVAGSLEDELRDALHAHEPATLDRGQLAILGAVIESWAMEIGVDSPDVQKLREAIADYLS